MCRVSVSAVILAGGKNTRMGGKDKSLLTLNGTTFIETIRNKLENHLSEIFVVSEENVVLREMNFSVFPDLIVDKGPLGGLYTALSVSEASKVLLIACDMPLLNEVLVENFIDSVSDEDVLIPLKDSKPEPLFAIYDRNCLPVIIDNIENGKLEMTSFFSGLHVRYLREETWRQWDKGGLSFKNINTPEDFEFSVKLNDGGSEN